MTVKELIKKLKEYDEDTIIAVQDITDQMIFFAK
jgi:hypothetical protein